MSTRIFKTHFESNMTGYIKAFRESNFVLLGYITFRKALISNTYLIDITHIKKQHLGHMQKFPLQTHQTMWKIQPFVVMLQYLSETST